ncbi:REX3 [Candida oxycetoniae]|uniref:RNA exonuclease 3 n=1 Tax=Candida oxycetoniae TaxID=497107 RepID=A0AAI9WYS7_9ASCO|nr:REX3 [Candida oxycetoniae]KAI3405666.2 REX3 [Candida oxycetoniae]
MGWSLYKESLDVDAIMLSRIKDIDGKPIKSAKSIDRDKQKRKLDDEEEEGEEEKKHQSNNKRVKPNDDQVEVDVKYILPKTVNTMPAPLPERKKHIEYIAKILLKNDPKLKTPKAKAIEIEYEIAKKTTFRTYASSLRNEVYKLQHPEKFNKTQEINARNDEQELKILKKMIIPVAKLEKYGYVMKIPQSKANKSLTRECRRCGTEFELAKQMESTSCLFHHGKLRRKANTKTRQYDCCLALQDDNSKPCGMANFHVFQVDKPEEKQSLLSYQYTTELFKRKRKYPVLGIDCEMGYTTKGFELMRISAVDYFTEKTVLDTYVLPYGEVVDFNTRFSGISEINGEFVSFNQSIQELGSIMDKDTILIGHGLENDMNAMRLIHENIIDTSILYPKFDTSPTFRWSLKDLAFKYLSKNIQVGEHDSAEDSIAAIEIVKFHVKRTH